jgi:hypothetical protein
MRKIVVIGGTDLIGSKTVSPRILKGAKPEDLSIKEPMRFGLAARGSVRPAAHTPLDLRVRILGVAVDRDHLTRDEARPVGA